LKDLRLRFKGNVYFAAPDQGWFKWGPTWSRHKSYSSLNEFQADLGIDADSEAFDPGFLDLLQLDFRLPSDTLARLNQCYPQGPIPSVTLGVSQ
jgi:hypothetical protein